MYQNITGGTLLKDWVDIAKRWYFHAPTFFAYRNQKCLSIPKANSQVEM